MKIRTVLRVFRVLFGSSVLFFGAATPLRAEEPADLIVLNAKIITGTTNITALQAMAVRGDSIIALGKDKLMDRFKGPKTHIIDAQGKTVMPGIYDGHVHSYSAAVSELNGPIPQFNSIADIQAYLRQQTARLPTNSWILVSNAFATRLAEARIPTKAELDEPAPNHPVVWLCGDWVMANTRALEISRITADTRIPFAAGSEVVLDPVTRKPTGLIRNAIELLKLPVNAPIPPAQQRNAVKHLHALYNQQGITSISERHATTEGIDLFRSLNQAGELTVRVNCSRYLEPGKNADENAKLLTALTNASSGMPYGPTGVGDEFVRIGHLDVQMDGDIYNSTAYMRTPWGIGPVFQITEPAYRGNFEQNQELLAPFLVQAALQRWQISADCTGDAALDQLLNCYQKVQFKTDIHQRRFLVSHATFQADNDYYRCRQLGIGAELEPVWLYKDGAALQKIMGDKRLKHFLPLNHWMDAELTIGGGSDHLAGLDSLTSVNPYNPWLGIWIAVARKTEAGREITPDEKLTREQAIRFYTYNNAYLNFEENRKGSLELGKLADFILLDRDLLKCPVDDIRATKVLLTVVGGKIVWEAK